MFEISITGWTSDLQGVQLPICQVASDTKIDFARMEYDMYPSRAIDIVRNKSRHAVSCVVWIDALMHLKIGHMRVYIVNYSSCIGCSFYSISSRFFVNSTIQSKNTQGIENLFLRLDDGEVFQVA